MAAMWNDTDLPLGYLITFRCYGTWLHGDQRGSIDRWHNRYKSPYLPPSDRRRIRNEAVLKREDGNWNESHSPWADKGSNRYLWNEAGLARAIEYVINGQGDDLPELDD